MAFKMRYDNTSFPFLGMNKEQWEGGASRKQARVERRLRNLKTKGRTNSRKYQRNLDRIAKMKEEGTYVPQGVVGDGQGNLVSRGTLGKGGDTEYGSLYYQGADSGETTAEQNAQLANLRHKG
jgi:hypothetical protein